MMLGLTPVYQIHAFLSDSTHTPDRDNVLAREVFQHDKSPFSVAYLELWPLSGSEAGVEFLLLQACRLFRSKC